MTKAVKLELRQSPCGEYWDAAISNEVQGWSFGTMAEDPLEALRRFGRVLVTQPENVAAVLNAAGEDEGKAAAHALRKSLRYAEICPAA